MYGKIIGTKTITIEIPQFDNSDAQERLEDFLKGTALRTVAMELTGQTAVYNSDLYRTLTDRGLSVLAGGTYTDDYEPIINKLQGSDYGRRRSVFSPIRIDLVTVKGLPEHFFRNVTFTDDDIEQVVETYENQFPAEHIRRLMLEARQVREELLSLEGHAHG